MQNQQQLSNEDIQYYTQVATIILHQLGGDDFKQIMGITSNKDLGYCFEDKKGGLAFSINSTRNTSSFTSCRILLSYDDTYEVMFCDKDGNVCEQIDDIYADMLSDIILNETGIQIPEYSF